jgi:hypothetical protein
VYLNLVPDAGWQVEVDRATPAEWSHMLDLFSDANLYQTWSYGRVRWGEENLSHLVLKRRGEVLAMAQLRIAGSTRFRLGMAYLRWGPLCQRRGMPPDAEAAALMARALEVEYVSKRKLFLRVLPNAFVGTPRAELMESAFQGFTPEPGVPDSSYRTCILDVAPPLETLRARLDKKWRNQLSNAERRHLMVICGSGRDEYRKFTAIYNQMKRRKAFESTVNIEEFGRMQEDLPQPHRMLTLICEDSGEPVAGLVASAMGDSAIYVLGATSDSGLQSKGGYLLQWSLITWLKENGYRWYDLGGIDPERNPGVYHFKSGLSGVDASHMAPVAVSNGAVSSAIVRTGITLHRALRGCAGILSLTRSGSRR